MRKDVQEIVRNCSGCHYGSYPEVTLSVRSPSAFFDRVKLVFSQGAGQLSRAPIQEGFLEEIERVKSEAPDVYPKSQWMDKDLQQIVTIWNDVERRRELIKKDLESRRSQGRVRGEGQDVVIGPEHKKT
jgi:hypothetical protein